MAVITVGSDAVNEITTLSATRTGINYNGAADGTGTLQEAQIHVSSEVSGLEIATFIDEGSAIFSTRDNETIAGAYAAGYHEIALDDMAVESGDFIGSYHGGGTVDKDYTGHAGIYVLSGDYIPADSDTFTLWGEDSLSLKGIGVTGNGGETAYDTMASGKSSWNWDKCDYGQEGTCPVGSKSAWVWEAPSAGVNQTRQGAKSSWAWDTA